MSSTEEKNTVLFIGNVDARQGDLRILSDEMTVYYIDEATEDKNASTQQKIEKLVCVGNVELSTEEWLGTSDKMIYYSGNRKIYLLGNAKAWQDENMVAGEKIIYYIDEGRSEVVGGAEAVVGEGEEKQEKKIPGQDDHHAELTENQLNRTLNGPLCLSSKPKISSRDTAARTVVDGISLRSNTGTVVGLLGPNGAGKTTTFYSIVGFINPMTAMSCSTARSSPTCRSINGP